MSVTTTINIPTYRYVIINALKCVVIFSHVWLHLAVQSNALSKTGMEDTHGLYSLIK
jgi:hypothetical protein